MADIKYIPYQRTQGAPKLRKVHTNGIAQQAFKRDVVIPMNECKEEFGGLKDKSLYARKQIIKKCAERVKKDTRVAEIKKLAAHNREENRLRAEGIDRNGNRI